MGGITDLLTKGEKTHAKHKYTRNIYAKIRKWSRVFGRRGLTTWVSHTGNEHFIYMFLYCI